MALHILPLLRYLVIAAYAVRTTTCIDPRPLPGRSNASTMIEADRNMKTLHSYTMEIPGAALAV
jgi:hypothetical protein